MFQLWTNASTINLIKLSPEKKKNVILLSSNKQTATLIAFPTTSQRNHATDLHFFHRRYSMTKLKDTFYTTTIYLHPRGIITQSDEREKKKTIQSSKSFTRSFCLSLHLMMSFEIVFLDFCLSIKTLFPLQTYTTLIWMQHREL